MTSTPTGQGTADDYFDINKFEQLLNRLESSKGRQQRLNFCISVKVVKAQPTIILISISLSSFLLDLNHPTTSKIS
jgi:hypothetical protein